MGYKSPTKIGRERRRNSHEEMASADLCSIVIKIVVKLEALEAAQGMKKPLDQDKLLKILMEKKKKPHSGRSEKDQ